MSDIFLSYASADRDHLRPLVRALEDQGWSVFWDRKIPVGQTWRGVIGREITDCLCIVVVWTQKSVQSEWVMEEAEEGKNRRILFPVSLDGTPPPFGFGSIQSADFSNWAGSTDHSGYRLLIGELTRHIQEIKDQQDAERLLHEKKLKEQAEAEQRKQEEIERKQREEQQHRLAMEKEQQDKVAKERAEKKVKQKEEERQAKQEADRQAKLEEERQTELDTEQKRKEESTKQELPPKDALSENNYKAVKSPSNHEDQVRTSKKKTVVISLTGVIALAAGGFFWFDTNPIQKNIEHSKDMLPEMVSIPSGNFTMGCVSGKDCYDDEKPIHEVSIAEFEMGKYEVTFKQWDACYNDGGCEYKPSDEGWGRDNRPVINVSWEDAQSYLKWLSQRTGDQYRLPSEAEWEYASRGGGDTVYSWGNAIGNNNANCDGCGSQWDNKKTAPVGSFSANQYGIHDMHGNVWEWTQDCYHGSYKGVPTNGNAWESGSCDTRVLRGGSWGIKPRNLRSATRNVFSPFIRSLAYGFRVARTP